MVMHNDFRGRPEDQIPLVLNGEDRKILNGLSIQAEAIQQKRVEVLRNRARKQGVIAKDLENLKSKSGKPFKEEAKISSGRFSGRNDYKRAVIKEEFAKGSLAKNPMVMVVESAYLCCSFYPEKDPDGCGWVKGDPVAKKYNNISVLSGSAGTRYYCKICGKLIGDVVFMRS